MATLAPKRALDLMRYPGRRLVQMNSNTAPGGKVWCLVPDGQVTNEVAEKIKALPDVICQEDGLFPGCSQSWKVQRTD